MKQLFGRVGIGEGWQEEGLLAVDTVLAGIS